MAGLSEEQKMLIAIAGATNLDLRATGGGVTDALITASLFDREGIEYTYSLTGGAEWIESVVKTATTTDATVTTIDTLTLDDDSVYLLRASIVTIESGGGDLGGGEIECLAKRLSGGNAAIQGTVIYILRRGTNGNLDFTFTVSGNDILARVTGLAATTMKWESVVKYRKLSG